MTAEKVDEYKAPNITRYSDFNCDEGYIFIFVDNQEERARYTEKVTFTNFEDSTLFEYEITVEAG